MKKSSFARSLKCLFCLCVLLLWTCWLAGCSAPGETSSEVHRRHKRVLKNNLQQAQDDIDAVFLIDKPSKLSDKVVR